MYKLLICTTDPTCLSWKSLETKRKTIEHTLSTVQNGDFSVEIVGVYVEPKVVDGGIDHDWYNSFSYPLYRQGYDFLAFHMGDAQRTKWGIKPTLRGASQIDTDYVGETYFWADEATKRNGYNQFIETCLHEVRHELMRGKVDDTHALHDKHGTIVNQFVQIDMNTYLPARREQAKQLNVIKKLVDDLVVRFQQPKPFLDRPYPITQAFGVPNPLYKQTGHHIGTDFATPAGTIIYAPLNGTLTKSYGTEVGNMATLKTHKGTYQFLHLSHCAPNGYYVQGKPIGVTGNSGTVKTGVHVCVRLWNSEPNIGILTKDNFKQYLRPC